MSISNVPIDRSIAPSFVFPKEEEFVVDEPVIPKQAAHAIESLKDKEESSLKLDQFKQEEQDIDDIEIEFMDEEDSPIEKPRGSERPSRHADKIMPAPAVYDSTLHFDKSIAGNSSGFNYGWAKNAGPNGRLSVSGFHFMSAQAAA